VRHEDLVGIGYARIVEGDIGGAWKAARSRALVELAVAMDPELAGEWSRNGNEVRLEIGMSASRSLPSGMACVVGYWMGGEDRLGVAVRVGKAFAERERLIVHDWAWLPGVMDASMRQMLSTVPDIWLGGTVLTDDDRGNGRLMVVAGAFADCPYAAERARVAANAELLDVVGRGSDIRASRHISGTMRTGGNTDRSIDMRSSLSKPDQRMPALRLVAEWAESVPLPGIAPRRMFMWEAERP
jgi:hypothetical protein